MFVASATLVMANPGSSETALQAAGRVVDTDSGTPVAGATVVLTHTVLSDDAAHLISTSAVTNADGSYVVANVPSAAMNVQVYSQGGYPTLHHGVDFAPGIGEGSLKVAKPTNAERRWLARINFERARYGLHAVVFDQSAIASARYWATYMARNKYFDHTLPRADPNADTPSDATPVTRYLKFSGLDLDDTNGMSENIAEFDGDASWSDAEDMFMAEKSKCPHGSPNGCAYGEATGHFLNILNPDFKWVGLGIAKIGGQTYYDQEFVVGA